jgi:hypothetical protein
VTASAYLDNCISPTRVVRQQLPQVERDALEELNRREAAGMVELYTSDVVREESEQIATACSRRHDGEAAGGRRLSGGAPDEVVQRPRRSDPTEKKHKK